MRRIVMWVFCISASTIGVSLALPNREASVVSLSNSELADVTGGVAPCYKTIDTICPVGVVKPGCDQTKCTGSGWSRKCPAGTTRVTRNGGTHPIAVTTTGDEPGNTGISNLGLKTCAWTYACTGCRYGGPLYGHKYLCKQSPVAPTTTKMPKTRADTDSPSCPASGS